MENFYYVYEVTSVPERKLFIFTCPQYDILSVNRIKPCLFEGTLEECTAYIKANGTSADVESLMQYIDKVLSESKFEKADKGKLQWSLLPFAELEQVVKVLTEGAKKYKPHNWKNCDDVARYKDALLRHITAYMKGDKVDEEFGCSHLAHAICNCLFLMWFDNQ